MHFTQLIYVEVCAVLCRYKRRGVFIARKVLSSRYFLLPIVALLLYFQTDQKNQS